LRTQLADIADTTLGKQRGDWLSPQKSLLSNNGAGEITARNSQQEQREAAAKPQQAARWRYFIVSLATLGRGATPALDCCFEEMNERILLHSWQVIKFSRSLKLK
jgi:hypothetical protein